MWWVSSTACTNQSPTATSTVTALGTGGWINAYPLYVTQTSATTAAGSLYANWQSQTGTASAYYNAQQLMLNRVWTRQQVWQEQRQVREVTAMAAPAILRPRQRLAAQRARDLLISLLSDEQRRTHEQHGWFIVVGGRSGRRYRINGGTYAGNVDLLAANDNNKVEARFCGHCDASIPLGDQLLAQKVMLEVDEPAYIALANRRAA